ncbi:MAG TPA: type II toxin-antitoxin system RelE/ParE family toxin [Accumulibacter sp.]|uniref:type II toxin-antitoxin system RelE/ParE family toxin n=1 Tax=Accumulibacter sp. TaxID=2053492 RepID=UPI0025FB71D6|nr:type II toxin-antitoxin system RelE/ParE family toxin [Accumulibacter sp.]MCM8598062.1 type II toxin-antitoxin system RelE/ParE family toxin [Accumulibacter sp.]HNC53284.1 type II toxin-antitoxin system RelE/ParE family toxin [Accumulibacter sp.]
MDQAAAAIKSAAAAAARSPYHYREGKKQGTREYVMRRSPYIPVYRVQAEKISIVRVLHQAMRYFN